MRDTQGTPAYGHTRWRRFALVMLPAVIAATGLGVLMGNGAIAASFAVSGQNFKVSADRLVGEGFEQFGTIDTSEDGTKHPVAVSAIENATLSNLCQSVVTDTPVGAVTLRITAGEGRSKVTADRLVVDAAQLSGDTTFTNIEIGRDASTLDKVEGAQGDPGVFGQQADKVVIKDLEQVAWATTAGTFKLPNLHLSIKRGKQPCF